MEDEVLALVPIGEENAVSSRLLWQQLNKWASSSVRSQLSKMASQGPIRSKIKRHGETDIMLYFRSAETSRTNSTLPASKTICE
jgi:hypothetical protein